MWNIVENIVKVSRIILCASFEINFVVLLLYIQYSYQKLQILITWLFWNRVQWNLGTFCVIFWDARCGIIGIFWLGCVWGKIVVETCCLFSSFLEKKCCIMFGLFSIDLSIEFSSNLWYRLRQLKWPLYWICFKILGARPIFPLFSSKYWSMPIYCDSVFDSL